MSPYGILTPPVGARDHVIGRVDAPVILLLYGDFECPYSGKASVSVKRLLESMPDELRFVYRHYLILPKHKHAQQAAEASEAAAFQGMFWEYYDLLYGHQGELGEQDLIRHAADLNLDIARFKSDLTSGAFRERVMEDHRSGDESGVMGTPTFFINGDIYEGYYEYRELFDAIDAAKRKNK